MCRLALLLDRVRKNTAFWICTFWGVWDSSVVGYGTMWFACCCVLRPTSTLVSF